MGAVRKKISLGNRDVPGIYGFAKAAVKTNSAMQENRKKYKALEILLLKGSANHLAISFMLIHHRMVMKGY